MRGVDRDSRAARLAEQFRGWLQTRIHMAAWVMLCAIGALAPGSVHAGRIHPALEEELSRLQPIDAVTAIFALDPQAEIKSLDAALTLRSASRQERHFEVVTELRRVSEHAQAPFLLELTARQDRGEVLGFTSYWIGNLVVVRGTRSAIEDLANRAEVSQVEPNFQATLVEPMRGEPGEGQPRGIGITPGLVALGAQRVWRELGIDGAGALVAVQDTGVDGNHPALMTRWRGFNGAHPANECWLDVVFGNTTFPRDFFGHGTHVMGTITGLGAATNDTIGVAWGAQWIACNSIGQDVSSEFDNDVITCLQWIADPDEDPTTVDDVPDVLQNSWRVNETFFGYNDCDMRWWEAIDNCEAAGVVTTWSAGNEGPLPATIGSPPDRADTPWNTFSVGAVDAGSSTPPYMIASFSSRGPTLCVAPLENRTKPEVVAPGVDVYSSWPGNRYEYLSGTSMAGPHVAGVVALMRAANPDLEVDAVKQILMDTAVDHGPPGEDNDYGWGFIDAYAAVQAALEVTTSIGEPAISGGGAVLFAGVPNPFHQRTVVRYRLPSAGLAEMAVFDLNGRRVRSFDARSGEGSVVWNARDDAGRRLPAGIYFLRLSLPGSSAETKLVVR